jgi:hypothetical protein
VKITQISPTDYERKSIVPVEWIRLLPLLMVATFIFVILPNSGCGKGVFPGATTSATGVPTSTTSSTATPAIGGQSFEMRGSGSQVSSSPGTCSGQTCNASLGNCECLVFTGSLLSTVVGNSNFTASLTVNLDDCTATGTVLGVCCNGDGLFNASNGSGSAANLLALTAIGPFCFDPNAGQDTSLEGNFTILPSSSTGKFLDSTGTGLINIFTDLNTKIAYVAVLGEIQLTTQ